MESVREKFVRRFGEEEAKRIEAAAEGHENDVHDNRGTDPFKWALLICIGYQCMEVDRYRKYHGIESDWGALKKWIKKNAHLDAHDGDCDYLSLLGEVYNEYMPKSATK